MENNEKKRKWKINLFDIVFIACAVVIAALILVFANRSGGSTVLSGPNGKVRYTLEMVGMLGDTATKIKPGDSLVDKIEKRPMGTVVGVDVQRTRISVKNQMTGERVIVEEPVRYTATVTVEADANITSTQISIPPGGFVVRVGTWVSVNGPLYNSVGYIIDMERDDEQ